ncbi:MAG: UTP--glucose-1-phosphate uridylyltransferase, partial [Anaerolineae bacterium]
MQHFRPFQDKMQAAGLPKIFIQTFAGYYEQLAAGETGLIPESTIEPVTELPDAVALDEMYTAVGEQVLAQTAVIKLNGGLGTSMGLRRAKSLLPVKDGMSFLDIIARQAIVAGVPLLLMNSFATDADSLAALARYPELKRGLPLSFVQHKEPKVDRADLSPAVWPDNPELEWCPPGHGDIYAALVTSGTLDALLAAGIRYAFVSNADTAYHRIRILERKLARDRILVDSLHAVASRSLAQGETQYLRVAVILGKILELDSDNLKARTKLATLKPYIEKFVKRSLADGIFEFREENFFRAKESFNRVLLF